jgi:hypothetical protein
VKWKKFKNLHTQADISLYATIPSIIRKNAELLGKLFVSNKFAIKLQKQTENILTDLEKNTIPKSLSKIAKTVQRITLPDSKEFLQAVYSKYNADKLAKINELQLKNLTIWRFLQH